MAFAVRKEEADYVTPKERERLDAQQRECAAEMTRRLDALPEYAKPDFLKMRDHCLSKFPKIPRDLSVWQVAYYEDWLREYNKVMNPE